MEGTVDTKGIYNAKDKELFLEKYENLNTKRAFVRIFRNTIHVEEELKKDLYLFTREELETFFENTSPSTKISARNYGRMINMYLRWAVDENIIAEHPFPVQQHYFLRYVKQEDNQYLDIKELRYFTHNYFSNKQDGVILELLFFGIQGREGSEICNLTIDDLDKDNLCIHVVDDSGRKRTVQFEDDTVINYCIQANKDEIYYKRNEEIESNPRIRPYTDLVVNTNYVLKNSNTNVLHNEKATKYTLYNRLKSIQKFVQIEEIKHKMTIKNIVKSGQLYMASKLYEKEGELDLPQIRKICKHFGTNEHWSLRDYLNEENLFSLYPHVKKFKKK